MPKIKLSSARDVQRDLRRFTNPARAKVMLGFFKTGKGEYGEGDVFIGASVPQTRSVVKRYRTLSLNETVRLLKSKVHEDRLAAVLLLDWAFAHTTERGRKKVYEVYLANTRYINSWDIIDSSAPYIVGPYLLDKPRAILRKLAHSSLIWDRRISILSTAAFIKAGEYHDTLEIARILLSDQHDLIQKAVGWMLREVGKRDQTAEEAFLRKYAHKMPRTMLRYAIEKFPTTKRQWYLAQKAATQKSAR